jgi:hypothetical protein
MTSRLLAISFAAVTALSAPALAVETGKPRFTTLVLSKFCNSAHGGGYDDGICAGFITGVADAMLLEPGMENKLCMPRNVSTADFSKLVTRHLARRPELQQQPAAPAIREALLAAYAC